MSGNIELRRIMRLNAIDTGIFSVLRVIPEHIESLFPISDRETEITIKNCEGTTKVKVAHSEKEIRDLMEDCLRQDGISDVEQT